MTCNAGGTERGVRIAIGVAPATGAGGCGPVWTPPGINTCPTQDVER